MRLTAAHPVRCGTFATVVCVGEALLVSVYCSAVGAFAHCIRSHYCGQYDVLIRLVRYFRLTGHSWAECGGYVTRCPDEQKLFGTRSDEIRMSKVVRMKSG